MSKVTKGGKGGHQEVEEGLKRNWNLSSFLLLEMTQVVDQIAWVRCAYGNVLLKQRLFIKINFYDNGVRNKLQHTKFQQKNLKNHFILCLGIYHHLYWASNEGFLKHPPK